MTRKKVVFLIAIIIPIAFIINGFTTYFVVKKNVEKRTEIALKAQIMSVESIIDLNRREAMYMLSYDMKVAHNLFYNEHTLKETDEEIIFKAINQITKKEAEIKVKKWFLNDEQLHFNYQFVDELQDLVGTTATVFQKIDSGFVRISTNVLKTDSSRAVGTYIPNNSPVVKTIMEGKQYLGRAYVVNDWYLTAYEPIWINNEIKGMLYVGVKEKEFKNLRSTLTSIEIGKTGYIEIFDENGIAIIHPTMEGKDISKFDFFQKAKEGTHDIIYYNFENKNKIASIKYYEPFHWYILITMQRNELFEDFLASIQIFTILFSIILSIIILYLITRIFVSHTQEVQNQQILLELKNKELASINNTKDKLFSIISHDLKNPFNSLIGLSDILIKKYSVHDDIKRLELLNQMYKSSLRNFDLLENLLQWSKTQLNRIKVEKSQFDLQLLAQTAIDHQIATIEQKQIIIKNHIPFSYIINADENLLHVVLRNLISNAIKYSKTNSEIIISTENNQSFLKIFVEDHGIGMTKEKLDSIFNLDTIKSERGTNNEIGTGLGLIICKEFIEKHNGTIKVESELGKGSKFIISLPV